MATNGTFWRTLAAAYAAPITRSGSVLRIFWPLFLIGLFGILMLLAVSNFMTSLLLPSGSHVTDNQSQHQLLLFLMNNFAVLYAIGILIFITSIYLFASGLVQWHRTLVIDEPARTLRILPSKRNFHYTACWIAIGILTAHMGLLFLLPLFFGVIVYAKDAFELFGESPENLFRALAYLNLIYVVISVPALALAFKFLGRRVLFLPMLSVESANLLREIRKTWRRPKDSAWPWILCFSVWPLSTIPILANIALIEAGLIKFPNLASPALATLRTNASAQYGLQLLTIFAGFYGMLVFASTLSIYYREHVHPTLLAPPE